jgi:hypothetical protein
MMAAVPQAHYRDCNLAHWLVPTYPELDDVIEHDCQPL